MESVEAAEGELRAEARQGDHILIKASRALALETLVDALVAR